MGKNDFDIDFDFNEEDGFDPKAFLGTEEYDENIDLDAFSDEELGLTSPKKASAPADDEEFDENDEWDAEDFLNMRRREEPAVQEEEAEEAEDWTQEEPEEVFQEEAEYSEEDSEEEYDEEEDRYVAKHHPFTAPMDEDIHLMDTDPGKIRAKAYDIILNGCELGGGSARIYSTELQEKMFGLLSFTKEQAWERFGYFLEAFQYGTPPHAGMAYGLDRLVMLISNRDSIRDVIAFPKVQTASELMTNSPDVVDDVQLGELHIDLVKPKKEE